MNSMHCGFSTEPQQTVKERSKKKQKLNKETKKIKRRCWKPSKTVTGSSFIFLSSHYRLTDLYRPRSIDIAAAIRPMQATWTFLFLLERARISVQLLRCAGPFPDVYITYISKLWVALCAGQAEKLLCALIYVFALISLLPLSIFLVLILLFIVFIFFIDPSIATLSSPSILFYLTSFTAVCWRVGNLLLCFLFDFSSTVWRPQPTEEVHAVRCSSSDVAVASSAFVLLPGNIPMIVN